MSEKLSAKRQEKPEKPERNNSTELSMSRPIFNTSNKQLRARRARARVHGTASRPRLAVFRGLACISAQLIDDAKSITLCAVSERELADAQKKGTKTQRAQQVGILLARKAKEKGITSAVFDRRGNKYHGRIKAFAESARQEGLQL